MPDATLQRISDDLIRNADRLDAAVQKGERPSNAARLPGATPVEYQYTVTAGGLIRRACDVGGFPGGPELIEIVVGTRARYAYARPDHVDHMILLEAYRLWLRPRHPEWKPHRKWAYLAADAMRLLAADILASRANELLAQIRDYLRADFNKVTGEPIVHTDPLLYAIDHPGERVGIHGDVSGIRKYVKELCREFPSLSYHDHFVFADRDRHVIFLGERFRTTLNQPA